MPGRFHTVAFHVYSDELRAQMSTWLTEQSAAGWEPISMQLVTTKGLQTPQVLILLRQEITEP